jgi:hypothetical protein
MWKSTGTLEGCPSERLDNPVDKSLFVIHISTFSGTFQVIHRITNKLFTRLSTTCG